MQTECEEYEKLQGSAVHDRPEPTKVRAQKHKWSFAGTNDSSKLQWNHSGGGGITDKENNRWQSITKAVSNYMATCDMVTIQVERGGFRQLLNTLDQCVEVHTAWPKILQSNQLFLNCMVHFAKL